MVWKSTALLAAENVRDTRLQAVRMWRSWTLAGSRWDTISEMSPAGKTSGMVVSLRAQVGQRKSKPATYVTMP